MTTPTIVWFRQDLRLEDNPALDAAVRRGEPVIPVYIWAPEEEGKWAPGGASRWWLHQSLKALEVELEGLGSKLVIRAGSSLETLREVIRETGAKGVYWNRRYEPAIIERDKGIKAALKEDGIETESFNSALLLEPWEVCTKAGNPYQVFTPFWKACLEKIGGMEVLPRPAKLRAPATWPLSVPLGKLELEPRIDWARGMREAWLPGSAGALTAWRGFMGGAVGDYSVGRDIPGRTGTSRMSPHLHFGEISPRRLWRDVMVAMKSLGDKEARGSAEIYLKEVGWREFAHHLLYHFPRTPERPLRADFENFPWTNDLSALKPWTKGLTGYPIVDAGMRELWQTGWMHNRVRMIVASFLVKDLLIPWQEGALWFWNTLVDADLASNTLGWQWTAGCGADAAPYFRVFNPVSQGEKFDPQGAYVRRWIPEIAGLPDAVVHKPWEAPGGLLKEAGIVLGRTYPKPIVDHGEARRMALEAFSELKKPL